MARNEREPSVPGHADADTIWNAIIDDIDGVTYVHVSGFVETAHGRRCDLEFSDLMGSTIVKLEEAS